MKKFYILTQGFSENKGSYFSFFEELAKIAAKRGYSVTFLCRKRTKDEKAEERLSYANIVRFPSLNIKVFNMAINEIIFSFRVKAFFKRVRLSEEDIIIANGYTSLGLNGKNFFLRAPDQPAFTIVNNMEIAKNHVSLLSRGFRFLHYCICYFFDRSIIKNAQGILFSSAENKKEFIKKYGRIDKPFFIPYNFSNIFQLSKTKISKTKRKKILFIAKSEERIRKGTYYLEKALPEIFEKYSDTDLIHIGDNIKWNVPEKYRRRIISVGKIPSNKMKEYYNSADVFLLCSISEGIPAALIEAMEFACPIVSSDIIGVKEYISHKEEGYIFKRGDTEELKKGIYFMLDSSQEAKKMGENAQKKIQRIDSKAFYPKLFDFMENKKRSYNLLK